MRKATRVASTLFGIFAGIGGLEHGYFEILQGSIRPEGNMIASMGAPCVPEEVWHRCEPAMTIIPNLLSTGIVAIVLGVLTIIWAAFFIRRKEGGIILGLLSFGLLLFGGGIFPPAIGIVGGMIGTKINTPSKRQSSIVWRTLAKLWPYTMVVFYVGLLSQFVIGYFFNEYMMKSGFLIPILIFILLITTVLAAYGFDVQRNEET